jgi:adhesin HecA-like repeat protein
LELLHGAGAGHVTRLLKSRLREERGSVLVLVAASMTVLVGCGAFVLDLGNSRQTARNEQNAADAGALGGAVGLPSAAGALTGGAFQSAAHYAYQTLLGQSATEVSCPSSGERPPGQTKCYQPSGGGQGTIVYVTTPWGPDTIADGTSSIVAPADNQIHVKVCSDVATGLAKIFGVGNLRPCREATAINTLSSALPYAFGAMAETGSGTFKMSGGGDLTVTGNVVVNSNTDNGLCDVALQLEGSGNLAATSTQVRDPAGAADAWEDCGIGSFFPQPVNSFSNPPLSDPLCPNPNDPSSCLSYPGDPGCPPPANCNSTTIEAPGDTIWPGVYDEIIVNSGTLTMMPGLYVFRGTGGGSKFEINGGNVVGNGVTLFFGCENYPATCGSGERGSYLSMGKNPPPPCPPSGPPPPCTPPQAATATFRAPLPGTYPDDRIPGMAIFFDRNNTSAPSDTNPGIGIWGDASLDVTGTIYAPAGFFRMVAGGDLSLDSAVIVNTFEHSGSGNVIVTYTEDENVKVTGGIALIS